MPTILEAAQLEQPEVVDSIPQKPIEGVSPEALDPGKHTPKFGFEYDSFAKILTHLNEKTTFAGADLLPESRPPPATGLV